MICETREEELQHCRRLLFAALDILGTHDPWVEGQYELEQEIKAYLKKTYSPPPIAKGSVWISKLGYEGTLMAWDENEPVPDGFFVVESEKC
jgi:hypothetical protein